MAAQDYEQVTYNAPAGAQMGATISEKIAFYGLTPISQRAGAAQNTTAVGTASSTDVTTDLKAAVIEIMNTLTAIGVWKGSA